MLTTLDGLKAVVESQVDQRLRTRDYLDRAHDQFLGAMCLLTSESTDPSASLESRTNARFVRELFVAYITSTQEGRRDALLSVAVKYDSCLPEVEDFFRYLGRDIR